MNLQTRLITSDERLKGYQRWEEQNGQNEMQMKFLSNGRRANTAGIGVKTAENRGRVRDGQRDEEMQGEGGEMAGPLAVNVNEEE